MPIMHPTVEPLEPRRLLSAMTATPAAANPPALTVADRRELLRNWAGANAGKLQARLDAGDLDAFDYRLLEYVRTRRGPAFFWGAGDIPGHVAFVGAELARQAGSAVALADQILAGRFPEQTTS